MVLLQSPDRGCGIRQIPIRGRQNQQISTLAVTLPDLKGRLTTGNIVSPMSVDHDDASETMRDKVVNKSVEQIKPNSGSGGDRSWKVHVVVGVSQPHQRHE